MKSALHSIALVSNNNSINLAIYHDGEWKSVIDDTTLETFLNEITKETNNPDVFKLEYRY